jgi:hypothetical protein
VFTVETGNGASLHTDRSLYRPLSDFCSSPVQESATTIESVSQETHSATRVAGGLLGTSGPGAELSHQTHSSFQHNNAQSYSSGALDAAVSIASVASPLGALASASQLSGRSPTKVQSDSQAGTESQRGQPSSQAAPEAELHTVSLNQSGSSDAVASRQQIYNQVGAAYPRFCLALLRTFLCICTSCRPACY